MFNLEQEITQREVEIYLCDIGDLRIKPEDYRILKYQLSVLKRAQKNHTRTDVA